MPVNFNRLRMQNLFGSPDFQPSLDIFGQQQQQPPSVDINQLLKPIPFVGNSIPMSGNDDELQSNDTSNDQNLIQQSYKPRSDFSEALIKSLGEMPSREQFGKPSKWRQFGGIVAGLSGEPGSREAFTNAPYYRAQGDWKQKIDTLMKGATEEDRYNTNQRLLAQATGKYGTEQDKLELRKKRDAAYIYDKQNPNLQKIVPNTGNIQLYNPKTGETTDTGIDVGRLTDEQKIKMRSGARLEEIKAQIEGNVKLEGEKQTNRATNIEATGEQQRQTKQTSGSYAGSPTQEKVAQYNKARQFTIENPDLAKWIQLDTAGPNTFSVHAPSTGNFFSSGPSKEEYDKIVSAITGTSADKQLNTTQGNESRVNVVDITTGKVIGTIPKGDTSKLDKSKYKVQ